MEEVMLADTSKKMMASNTYKPHEWKWLNSKPPAGNSIVKVMDKEENFYFHSYSYTPQKMSKPMFFEEANEGLSYSLERPARNKSWLCWL